MEPFWLKMVLQGVILGPSWGPKSVKNRTFGPRSAQGPSKNDVWEGVWKKHEKLMKNRCRNGWFLMARNHVWRYTLRLFHTFAIFGKNRKVDAKRAPKIHENWSQNRLLADLWPSLSTFWLFWAMPKNDEILKPLWKVSKS